MAPRLANTLIIDNGASTIKAGFVRRAFTNEDCITIPNCIARTRDKRTLIGKQLNTCKDFGSISFRQPVEKGHLVSWEAEKEIWDKSFFDADSELKCDPQTTTLILTEAPNVTPALQMNCDQIVFEEYGFGAYYRCIASSLVPWNNVAQLFDQNNEHFHAPAECALVIDSGYSFTHVVPIINGNVVQNGIRRLDVGGKVMTNYLKEMFSVRQLNMMDETYIVNEVKETACYISTAFNKDLDKCKHLNTNDIVMDYLLPDYKDQYKGILRPHVSKPLTGTVQEQLLVVGNERFTVPELLFNPGDVGYNQAGLPEIIFQSVNKVPEMYRAALLANIVLVGGNANIPGFAERLQGELRPMTPEPWPVRIKIPSDPIKFIWQGGMALGNNKTALDQKRVTHAEYMEQGPARIAKKFAAQSGLTASTRQKRSRTP